MSKRMLPSFVALTGIIGSIRIFGAATMPIMDCDETYNYWEPMHFLLHGFGFQTWEYSPEFALRSYTYLLPYASISWLAAQLLPPTKVAVFFVSRGALGVLSAALEAAFLRAVERKLGPFIGVASALFLVASPGMLHAAPAFVPSTFAMWALLGASTLSLRGHPLLALLPASAGVLLGWPFAGLLFLPMGTHALVSRGPLRVFLVAVVALLIFGAVPVAIDSAFYGKPVFAALNIVLYNVFPAPGRGPDLYGTETWTFYPTNMALNFSLAVPLAALAPLALLRPGAGSAFRRAAGLLLSPLALWAAAMGTRPHKEERFLFPVYPLVAVAAAHGLAFLWNSALPAILLPVASPATARRCRAAALALAASAFVAASLSRAAALGTFYQAPLSAWAFLAEDELPARYPHLMHRSAADSDRGDEVTVCVGKEWHRFPGSFFLPSPAFRLGFVPSSFGGLLPQPFSRHPNATSAVPQHVNDLNRHEPALLTPLAKCQYVVDFELPGDAEESKLSTSGEWDVAWSRPFLDASSTPSAARAFYLPLLSPAHARFGPYVVLRRRAAKRRPDHAPSAAGRVFGL